jgi:hypothetical protein
MSDAWHSFWFQAGNPVHLGFVRAMFFLLLFVVARGAMLDGYARLYLTVPAAYQAVTFYRWFRAPAVPRWIASHMRLLVGLWYGSMLLGAAGILFPLGNLAAALLTLLLIGFRKQFGKINHARNLLPLFAIVLSFAPRDALCVAPLFELVGGEHGYFWPIQLGRVLLAICWFSAGIAKLRYAGPRWSVSDNLSRLLKLHVMDYYFVPPKAPRLARWLPQQPALCMLLASGTLIFELAYPIALFDPHAAMVIVPSSLLLILGFALAQGPLFVPLFTLTVLLWFPYAP